jgi:arsenate reductase (glutaredoxin)
MDRIIVYGIASCDTVRRACRELTAVGLEHRFHDFRKDGLGPALLDRWIAAVGWEALLNRRGATWRRLPVETREGIDAARARSLLLEQPTLVRRPVIERAGEVLVGWDANRTARLAGESG